MSHYSNIKMTETAAEIKSSENSLLSAFKCEGCQDANLVAVCCGHVVEDPVSVWLLYQFSGDSVQT